MYTLTHITKTYRTARHTVPALQDLNVVIEDGEWLAVQGRTGSGITTLLQLLGGLDRPSAGTIVFDGQDLTRLPETQLTRFRAASVGFVFQLFNLLPALSALENVETALVPLRLDPASRRRRALHALEFAVLEALLRAAPAPISAEYLLEYVWDENADPLTKTVHVTPSADCGAS